MRRRSVSQRSVLARRDFGEYLKRKQREHGERFDPSDLNKEFIPAFESGERVTVAFEDGECLRGTIGVTTGWKPVFLLVRTSRSLGSSDIIGKNDKIGGCKPTR